MAWNGKTIQHIQRALKHTFHINRYFCVAVSTCLADKFEKRCNYGIFGSMYKTKTFTSIPTNLKNCEDRNLCGISFAYSDCCGSLYTILKPFVDQKVNITRIENIPSPLDASQQNFQIHFEGAWDEARVQKLLKHLSQYSIGGIAKLEKKNVHWFPRSRQDIDFFSGKTLDAGSDLNSDHPGFSDAAYRSRRNQIVEYARSYHSCDPIPTVDYTDIEIDTWKIAYQSLKKLQQKYACPEYLEVFAEMEKSGLYSENKIPQLQDVSNFLGEKTGFTLRPIMGLLSGRDFLNALAVKVFFSTQYIRHHSQPLYTPEPDVIHELLGHAQMLANPDFARFSQIIGLTSLGATDKQIEELVHIYWFSVEFGLLQQDGNLKAFGAGLLSSFGELPHSTSSLICYDFNTLEPINGKSKCLPWNSDVAVNLKYPITTYQPVYFFWESLTRVVESILHNCEMMNKGFSVRYDEVDQKIITDVPIATV